MIGPLPLWVEPLTPCTSSEIRQSQNIENTVFAMVSGLTVIVDEQLNGP